MTISCAWTYHHRRIIGFADDELVVCAADDVGILELRINESLWWAKRWFDSRGLKMAPDQTEALLGMDRRSFQYPRIVLSIALRIVSAYRTVSTSAVFVLASVPSIDSLVEIRQKTF